MIKVLPSPMMAIEAMTDPEEIDRAQRHREPFERNWAWLKEHATGILTRYRGKHAVVAGGQLFLGDNEEEARTRMAEAAVDAKGSIALRVPKYSSSAGNIAQVVMMIEIDNPEEIAAAEVRRERSDRNAAWLQAHAGEIFARYRGKCVCIAGEEAFAADTTSEAVAQAMAAHPEDDGRLIYRVPTQRATRVYAH